MEWADVWGLRDPRRGGIRANMGALVCPHCKKPLDPPWKTKRANLVRQGLCVECAAPAHGFYRCVACRARAAGNLQKRRSAITRDSSETAA